MPFRSILRPRLIFPCPCLCLSLSLFCRMPCLFPTSGSCAQVLSLLLPFLQTPFASRQFEPSPPVPRRSYPLGSCKGVSSCSRSWQHAGWKVAIAWSLWNVQEECWGGESRFAPWLAPGTSLEHLCCLFGASRWAVMRLGNCLVAGRTEASCASCSASGFQNRLDWHRSCEKQPGKNSHHVATCYFSSKPLKWTQLPPPVHQSP